MQYMVSYYHVLKFVNRDSFKCTGLYSTFTHFYGIDLAKELRDSGIKIFRQIGRAEQNIFAQHKRHLT